MAPITVIIGKNGGGKSVLTRLPVLLSGGLASDVGGPLNLEAGGISHASRFEDLVFQRSAQPFSLGAEISGSGRTLRFVTTLRYIVERHELGLEKFEFIDSGQRVLSISAAPEHIADSTGKFIAQLGNEQSFHHVKVGVVGLFPDEIVGYADLSTALRDGRKAFETAFSSPSYLGPFRSEEGSLPRILRQGVRNLGPRGERALDILGDDASRGGGELVRMVEDWFETAMGGNRVKLVRAGGLPRLFVHDAARDVDVDICDTGAGFAQVLPVVVQAFALQTGRIHTPIAIVEQPELHLHPAAHGNIADLICNTAKARRDEVRYICETHSEQFVTRIRRRVAEGSFPPEMVKIISVGHQAALDDVQEPLRIIELDSFGNPNAWPLGVFNEAFDDLVHLREAIQRRLAQDDNGKP